MRHVPDAIRPAADFEDQVRERLGKLGWEITRVYRHFPPVDTDRPGEVLFRGHRKTAKRRSQKFKPLTCWIPQSAEGDLIVTDDWR